MRKLRVLSVVGTRPEGIKMAPVVRALSADNRITSMVCVTGQHREMLDGVLDLFQIRPDFDLNTMTKSQDLTDITVGVLGGLRRVIAEGAPDVVLAQGDTTSTLATSLASFYQRVPFGHVEAGLRSGDMYSPWPEEMNRKVASVVAAFHFAPTSRARANLIREGIAESQILVTGNTVIDALLQVLDGIKSDREFETKMREQFPFLRELDDSPGKHLVLVTGHRRESFGEAFEDICYALRDLSSRPDVLLVYPVHLNPNVREPVFRLLKGLPRVVLLEPLDYRPFVYLMSRATLIVTDSGGIQEEAPSLGKPVLVIRDVTERSEGVEAGTVRLVGTSRQAIVSGVTRLLDDAVAYSDMAKATNPYGDGAASARIVKALHSLPRRS